MSRINILGTIENIKSRSSVYTPIIEAIVNAVEAVTESGVSNGSVEIILKRQRNLTFDDTKSGIESIEIRDNGIGFNQKHRDSFDTFYSEEKKLAGGKGFGRFMFLKYFNEVKVESIYRSDNGKYFHRKFNFGKRYEIIVEETNEETDATGTFSSVSLKYLKEGNAFDKNLETVARKILERILILFIDELFVCPMITIKEEDDSQNIILNNFLSTSGSEIQLISDQGFELSGDSEKEKQKFKLKVFKLYFPGNQRSKVSLAAHKREVTDCPLHSYFPEFEDDFYDEFERENNGNTPTRKNYVIKSYVLGKYLDDNVNLERETFNFPKESSDLHYPIYQTQVEREAAKLTAQVFDTDVKLRSEKQKQRIRDYVTSSAPWHISYLSELDLSSIPYNADVEKIDTELHKAKFRNEQSSRADLKKILASSNGTSNGALQNVVGRLSAIGKSDLIHYVCSRKLVLDAFQDLLKRREDGKAEWEKEIHNVIFTMGKDSEELGYEDHNLWLLDERLVFSEYIASDKKISTKKDALREPDLVIFDKKRSFRRGDNEFSNPLTIFEFKRPKRENYKDDEDPINQVGEYLEDIRAGKYEMPEGLEKIKVNENTPVYGYVVCDIAPRIKEFAKRSQLILSPDQEGYFGYHSGYKMYIEILSFKKLLNDATLRNKIFFKKLQLE